MTEREAISRRRFVKLAASLPAGLLIAGPLTAQTGQEPFASAIALWHMGEPISGQAGLRVEGEVRLGVPLRGEERTASIRRGGDATVAEFRDGYLVLGEGRSL